MRKIFFIIGFVLVASVCQGATYNYHFSDDASGNAAGNDSTGDGSIGNPWKTLDKFNTVINALSDTDIVNAYFDKSDDWTWDSANVGTTIAKQIITSSNPIVNIDAYGSGNDPIFDGLVTDFSAVDNHNASTGPLKWNRFFSFERGDCSISNVEIKRTYGHGIFLKDADNFTLSNSSIHDFGSMGIGAAFTTGVENSTVEYSIFHTGQELYRNSKVSGWAAAISLTASDSGSASFCGNNHVYNNVVYDIYGECINAPNSIIENNIVGDCGSVAINTSIHDFDTTSAIVRYNFVLFSDWGSSIYDNHSGGDRIGVRVFDEEVGGNNSSGTVEVYGNIVINYEVGFKFACGLDCGNPFESVKIYNNTVIDSETVNYRIVDGEEATAGSFHNNTSILYDRTTKIHIQDDADSYASWSRTHNHFWTTGGSPVVDSDWRTNYNTNNPLLPGEELNGVDWDGQTGATYPVDIDVTDDLFPPSNSPLWKNGKEDGSLAISFLTTGTSLSMDPTASTWLTTTIDTSDYHIGALGTGGTVVLTGTAITGGVTEAEIVAGGETIITTADGGIEWVPTMCDDNAITTAYIAGMTSELSEAGGWNAKVKTTLDHTMCVRDTAAQITWTLPATADYQITATDPIIKIIPATAHTGTTAITATPTMPISVQLQPPPVKINVGYSGTGQNGVFSSSGYNLE